MTTKPVTITRLSIMLALLLAATAALAEEQRSGVVTAPRMSGPPESPGQPASGPGGRDYEFGGVVAVHRGTETTGYTIFEPEPKPASAPVVVLLHGYLPRYEPAERESFYREWIDHLVRKGFVVVFPVIHDVLREFPRGENEGPPTVAPESSGRARLRTAGQNERWSPPDQSEWYADTIVAIKDAIHVLQTESGHPRPEIGADGQMNFALTGHSLGAGLTNQIASLYPDNGVPKPKAILPIMGGPTYRPTPPYDTSNMPADIYVLEVSNDNTRVEAFNEFAKSHIRDGTPQVPKNHKAWVLFFTDEHGDPPLVADHALPCGAAWKPRGRLDAYDYYGVWKLSVALFDCAFYARDCEYALGGGPHMTSLGEWSDGQAVRPLFVSSSPE
jgi:acetyl esterase/lipase